jgi:hypothetical protein
VSASPIADIEGMSSKNLTQSSEKERKINMLFVRKLNWQENKRQM